MGMLDELNDAIDIAFYCNGEKIADRNWNYIPDVGDEVHLAGNTMRYRVESREFLDRERGFLSGLGPQRVVIDIHAIHPTGSAAERSGQLNSKVGLSSSHAIAAVLDGKTIRRSGWNGKGMYVYSVQFPGHRPCLVLSNAAGAKQPGWVFSQDDLFSADWEIIERPE